MKHFKISDGFGLITLALIAGLFVFQLPGQVLAEQEGEKPQVRPQTNENPEGELEWIMRTKGKSLKEIRQMAEEARAEEKKKWETAGPMITNYENTKDAYEKAKNERERTEREVRNKDRELDRRSADFNNANHDLKSALNELKKQQNYLDRAKQQFEQSQNPVKEAEQAFQTLKDELAKLRQQENALKEKLQQKDISEEAKAQISKDLETQQKAVAEKLAETEKAEDHVTRVMGEQQNVEKYVDEIQRDVENHERQVEREKQQVEQATERLEKAKAERDQAHKELQEIREAEKKYHDQYRQLEEETFKARRAWQHADGLADHLESVAVRLAAEAGENPKPQSADEAPDANAENSEVNASNAIVVTPHRITINKVSQVPIGIFGLHASRLSPELIEDWGVEAFRQIYQFPDGQPILPGHYGTPGHPHYTIAENTSMILETWYDRYQPAWVVSEPENWKKRFHDLAQEYGKNAAKTGRTHHVQFWNEPFVNWSRGPGVNFDGDYYKKDNTEKGQPMTIKGDDEPVPHAEWKEPQLRAINVEKKAVDYLATRYGPKRIKDEETGKDRDAKDGDTFTWRDTEYVWQLMPWGHDPSEREVGRPGKASAGFYAEMAGEFSKQMKEANPDVKVVLGWGYGIFSKGWQAWEHMNKPVIDSSWQYMDALSEHHYGYNPWLTVTSYEVALGYAMSKYNKWIIFYNTECGITAGRPPQPREGQDFAPVAFSYGKRWMDYMMRDVSMIMSHCPDKLVMRMEHEPHNNTGSRHVYRLFKQFRGDLVYATSYDPMIWVSAAVNETEDGATLCVVVYNDNNGPRDVPLLIEPPTGYEFDTAYRDYLQSEHIYHTLMAEPVYIDNKERFADTVKIEKKEGTKFLFHLKGKGKGATRVVSNQYFGDPILENIEPEKPIETVITIPQEDIKNIASAKVRIGLEGWSQDECELLINGKDSGIDPKYNWMNDCEIDPALLQTGENKLMLRTKADKGRKWTVQFVSIYTRSKPAEQK